MAARDLKAMMGKGNEIPAQSREEFIEQKKAKEESSVVEIPKPTIEPSTPKKAEENVAYTRKGYYFLSEENYWYLKDITFFKNIQMQDYLNRLIEADRKANADILEHMPHMKQFY